MIMNSTNWPLKGIDDVLDTDIMLGRGRGTNFHAGNKRYRAIVEVHKEKYRVATRIEKPMIALDIVNQVRRWSPPGRFLRRDEKTGKWSDVGEKKAREKTSQALREPKHGESKQGESPRLQPREASDSSNSSDSSFSSNSSHSTEEQLEKEDHTTEKPEGIERFQSIGTFDLNADGSNILDSDWEVLGGPDSVRSAAEQMKNLLMAEQLQNSLLIADQGNKTVGGNDLTSAYDSKLFDPRHQGQKGTVSNGMPPPIPPRAPRAQNCAAMKRETSNQEIFESAPKAKRPCCASKSEIDMFLKNLFLEKVLTNQICMEEFLLKANAMMGWSKTNNGMTRDDDKESHEEDPKILPSTQRTTSEDFISELLSYPDFYGCDDDATSRNKRR